MGGPGPQPTVELLGRGGEPGAAVDGDHLRCAVGLDGLERQLAW